MPTSSDLVSRNLGAGADSSIKLRREDLERCAAEVRAGRKTPYFRERNKKQAGCGIHLPILIGLD
jgi:hypothetical protein